MSRVYILPVFVRFMITRITGIDLEQDYGMVGGKLIITIRFRGIPKKYVDSVLNNISLTINDS